MVDSIDRFRNVHEMNRTKESNCVRCGWPTIFMIILFPAAFRCEMFLITVKFAQDLLKYFLSAAHNLVGAQVPQTWKSIYYFSDQEESVKADENSRFK